jgi:hypothetical protein
VIQGRLTPFGRTSARGPPLRARGCRLVGVRERKDDRTRPQPHEPLAPAEAAVDHHLAAAIADEQGAKELMRIASDRPAP